MAAAGGVPWAIAVALSHCCGLVVAFACGRARGMDALTTERYAGKTAGEAFLGVFKGLKAGKRQPWTPIRSHCCGRGDALSHCCGLVVAFACGRARGMDALTTERYAGKRPARHFRGLNLRVWSLSNGSLERREQAIAAAGGMPWAIAVALWWLLPAGVPEAWTP